MGTKYVTRTGNGTSTADSNNVPYDFMNGVNKDGSPSLKQGSSSIHPIGLN